MWVPRSRPGGWRGFLGLGVLLVLGAPGADAALAGTLSVEGRLEPLEGQVRGVGDALFVSGALSLLGPAQGTYAFFNASAQFPLTDYAVVRPFEPRIIGQAQGENLSDATVTVDAGATFLYLTPRSVAEARAAYAFSAVVDHLAGIEMVQEAAAYAHVGPVEPTLMAIGQDLEVSTLLEENGTAYLFLLEGQGNITSRDGGRPLMQDRIVEMRGPLEATFRAQAGFLPLVEGATAVFGRASEGAFEAGFDLGRIAQVASQMARIGSGAPAGGEGQGNESAGSPLESLGPLLNGAMFGRPQGALRFSGENVTDPGGTIIRFTDLSVTRTANGTYALFSKATLAYAGGQVRSDRAVIPLGPIAIPVLAFPLFAVGIGAFVASRFYRLRELDEDGSQQLKMPGRAAHIVLLVVSFVIFDQQVRFVTGVSFLGSLGLLGASSVSASSASIGIAAGLVFLPWGLALLFFALPVRLLAVSAFRMGGFDDRVRGFARGLGDLAALLLGSAFIAAFLGGVINALAGAFGG